MKLLILSLLFTLSSHATTTFSVDHCTQTARAELNQQIEDYSTDHRYDYCYNSLCEIVIEEINFSTEYNDYPLRSYNCRTYAEVKFKYVRMPW